MSAFAFGLERASLIGVAVLMVAWLAQRLLEERVPAAWRVWIWRVALIQTSFVLLPLSPLRVAVFSPPTSVRIPTARRDTVSVEKSVSVTSSGTQKIASPKIPPSVGAVTTPPSSGDSNAEDVTVLADSSQLEVFKLWCYWNQDKIWLALQGIYFLGVGFHFVRLVRSSRRLRRALRSAVTIEDETGLREIARRMKVSSLPRLVQIEGSAPFLVGIFRPCIVLPKGTDLQQRECEAILSHELAHLKRRDLMWNFVVWGAQTVLWFHPLVWVSRYFLPLEIESACDEMVLASTRITPNSYGTLLLNTLSIERTPLAAGVTDGFSILKTRLLRLNRAPMLPNRASKIIFAGAIGLAVVMALPIRLVSRSQAAPNRALQHEDSPQKKALIAKIGIVEGLVVTPDGKPVKDARITWVSHNGDKGQGREAILAKTQSDERGNFRFADSKALLEKSLDFVGPTQQSQSPHLLVEAEGWGCFAVRVTDLTPSSRALSLTRPTELQTTFLDPTGKPIANLPVRLSFVFFEKPEGQASNFKYIHFGNLKYFKSSTDANGVFHMGGLPQGGSARLEIDDERFANLEYEISDTELSRQAQTIAKPIHLVPGATLRGRITNSESGEPVVGIRVAAQGQGQRGWGEAVSDANGYYRMAMLSADRYNLALDLDEKTRAEWTAPAHEGVSVSTGSQQDNLDFKLEHGVLISGYVLAEGNDEPVEGAMIGIYGPAHPKSTAWVQGATSASDGSYQMRVPAGDQYIYIMGVPAGFVSPKGTEMAPVPLGGKHSSPYDFTAVEGEDQTIDWGLKALPPARDVLVRIVDANGQAAKEAQVEYSPTGEEDGGSIGEPKRATTDSLGRVTLEDVRGEIQIWAKLGQNATPEAKTALGGQNVTLKLQPNSLVELKGKVVDDAGKPLVGLKVNLYRWTQRSGRVSNSMLSDAQGGYSFAGLWPSGTYSLSVDAPGHGLGQADMFQLKPGETSVSKDIVLTRTTSFVAGRVVDATDAPVADVKVWISGTKTGSVQAKTDEKGNFRSDAIVPGDNLSLIATLDNRFGTANAHSGTDSTVIALKKR